MKRKNEIATIGHSNRTLDAFFDLLMRHEIKQIVDVRTIPLSRTYPQFNQEELKKSLKKRGISYAHLPKLGGLRHTTKSSLNKGWRNLSFRGFADYMQTNSFWEGIDALEKIGKRKRTAIMCAEAVPWRCHRSLIADALSLREWIVFHITSQQPPKEHQLTSFLAINGDGSPIYPDLEEKTPQLEIKTELFLFDLIREDLSNL